MITKWDHSRFGVFEFKETPYGSYYILSLFLLGVLGPKEVQGFSMKYVNPLIFRVNNGTFGHWWNLLEKIDNLGQKQQNSRG